MSILTINDESAKILALLPTEGVKQKLELNTIKLIMARNPEVPVQYFVELCHLAQQTGASLVTKEIMMTSRNVKTKVGGAEKWAIVGLPIFAYSFMLKRAQESGGFGGFKSDHGSEVKFNLKSELVESQYGKGIIKSYLPELEENGKITPYCEATVLRTGKCNTVVKVYLDECFDPKSPMWVKNWRLMLEKTAVSRAIRLQFPEWLSGMYSDAEMDTAADEAVFKIDDSSAIEVHEKIESTKKLAVEKLDNDLNDERKNFLIKIEAEIKPVCEGLSAQAKIEVVKEFLGCQWKDLTKKTLDELKEIYAEVRNKAVSFQMKKIGEGLKG